MRCGKCVNCQKFARVQKRVLACCGTPKTNGLGFNHVDDGVVGVWNKAVADYPCLEKPK
jgi:hypothetical protein